MSRKLKTLATLIVSGMALAAHAQGITFKDAAPATPPLPPKAAALLANAIPVPTPAAQPASAAASTAKPSANTKPTVDLLCEGKLRVFNLLPDGSERESGSERSHDINLRVIDKKAFRSYDDDENAIKVRFEDPKECLARSDGSACFRQIDNPDGRRMTSKDHLDINRFNGRMVFTHLRTFSEPVKRGEDSIAGVRLEYAALCSRADAPRTEPVRSAPAPRVEDKPLPPVPVVRTPLPPNGKAPSIWVIKGAAPDGAAAAPGTKP